MSITITNEYLGLSQGAVDDDAAIINSVCGDASLKIGDAVKLLPVGTGNGFTQTGDILPRVGLAGLGEQAYGIVVGGDFEGIYSNGVISFDSNNLALGLVTSFFGNGVRVCIQGRCLALASGPISIGDKLAASPTGLININGGNIIATALQGTTEPNGIIAVDVQREFIPGGGFLYYGAIDSVQSPFIVRSFLDGTNSIILPTNTITSSGYAVNSTSLYVTIPSTNLVTKSNLDGTNTITLPIIATFSGHAIDVDSTSIYLGSGTTVIKADLDGTNQVTLPITSPTTILDLAVSSTSIYVLNTTSIIKADLDGTNQVTLPSTLITNPNEIDVDSTSIYVLNTLSPAAIIKSDLDGTNQVAFPVTGGSFPSGLAVSSTSIYSGFVLSGSPLIKKDLDGTNSSTVPVPPIVAGVFEIDIL